MEGIIISTEGVLVSMQTLFIAAMFVLSFLIAHLSTFLSEEYRLFKSVRAKIMFLKAELEAMNAFLLKMSHVQEPDERDKHWMKETQKLSQDIHHSIDIDFFMFLGDDKATKPKGFLSFALKIINLLNYIEDRRVIQCKADKLQHLVIELGQRYGRFQVDYNISKARCKSRGYNTLFEQINNMKARRRSRVPNTPFEQKNISKATTCSLWVVLLDICSTVLLEIHLVWMTNVLYQEYKLFKSARDKIVLLKAELEAINIFRLKISQVEELDEQHKYWIKEVQALSDNIHDSINDLMLLVDDYPAKPKSFKGFMMSTTNLLKHIKTHHGILRVDNLEDEDLVIEVQQRRTRYKVDYNIPKATNSRSMEHDVLEDILDGTKEPTNLPFELLKNITRNFSEEREIGRGGFGMVYKGVLPNGIVAVKRFFSNHTINEKIFDGEVKSLLNVNHENVARFLGYCACTEKQAMRLEGSREYIYAEIRERLLCFEYISNGSLHKYITDELRGLDWNIRYQIIKQISVGLFYLHKEKHILHMDLKPENILLDNHMVAKIADFGLSRLDEKSQTMDANRCLTLGYSSPEYLLHGKMSVKSDMYSLGVIIIELVTGYKDTPDNTNVLRKWRHRWNKSLKETPWVYQQLQITKCIEIGLHCLESDPYKRPFISDVIDYINEIEDTFGQIGNVDESDVDQIRPCWEDDMLEIEPLKLYFHFEPNKQISCLLQLTNDTGASIAFDIQSVSLMPYCIKPNKGIVPPLSSCAVDITLQSQSKPPNDMHHQGKFVVRSTKVTNGVTAQEITLDMFNKVSGKVVDEVDLDVVFDRPEET